jgi:outer membrane receptor protein involved in Fe transport
LRRDDWLAPGLDASASVFGTLQAQRFSDRRDEAGVGFQDRDDTTVSAGGNATATYEIDARHSGAFFTELAHERFSPRNEVQPEPDGPDQERLRWTGAFQDIVQVVPELAALVPSIRYEHLEDDVTASFSPAGMPVGRKTISHDLWGGGLGLQVTPLDWMELKGNLGRYQRAPNFSELFGASVGIIGNPQLDPETVVTRDVGFALSPDNLPAWVDTARCEYSYFDNDADDLINLVFSSFAFARAQNIGAASIKGHELVVGFGLLDRVSFDLNYTQQNAKDRSNEVTYRGKQLPYRPQDELYGRVEAYDALGKLYYEYNFIGSNRLTRSGLRDKVGQRSIHTAGLALNAADWLTLRVEARNLSDSQIEDVANYPLPGRSFFGSVMAQF